MNETKKTTTKHRRTKTTKSRKKKQNRCENHYFNKMEREKRVREVILSQKLTLNHPL